MSKDNATMFFKARNYGVLACCLIALYVVLNLSKRLRSLSQLNILYMYFFYSIVTGPSRKLRYPCWAGPVQKIPLSLLGWARPENSVTLAGLGPPRKFLYFCWDVPVQKNSVVMAGPDWKNSLILATLGPYKSTLSFLGWARPEKFPYPCLKIPLSLLGWANRKILLSLLDWVSWFLVIAQRKFK